MLGNPMWWRGLMDRCGLWEGLEVVQRVVVEVNIGCWGS